MMEASHVDGVSKIHRGYWFTDRQCCHGMKECDEDINHCNEI